MENNAYNKRIADEVRKMTLQYLKQDAKTNFGGKQLTGGAWYDDLWSATSQGINTGLSILPAVLPFMGAGAKKTRGRPKKGGALLNQVQLPEMMNFKGGNFFDDIGGMFQKALPLLPLLAAGKPKAKARGRPKKMKGGDFMTDMLEGIAEGMGKPKKSRGRPRKGGAHLYNQKEFPQIMQGDGIFDDILSTVNKGFKGLERGLDVFDKGADVLNKYHRKGTNLVNRIKGTPSRFNKRVTGKGAIDDFLKNTFDTIDKGFETYDKFNKYKQRFGRGKSMSREERGKKVKEIMNKHKCSLGEASKMLANM